MALILNGSEISKNIRKTLKIKINQLSYKPHLAVIQVGKEHEGSNLYIKYKHKAALEVGIKSSTFTLSIDTTQTKLLDLINSLNHNSDVDGIIVQMPLPSQLNHWEVISTINPQKDVDGLHPINNFNLDNKLLGLRPATPKGILTLLNSYDIKIARKHIVIVSRSHLVGNPLHKLLRMENATITQCHSQTKNISDLARQADILIVATGNPGLVTADWVTKKSVVIDVSSPKGDCDLHFKEIYDVVYAITPVPGGIGPMTIVSLLENTVDASISRHKIT